MSPSEILNKAIVDSNTDDYISQQVSDTIVNWDNGRYEPNREELLYVVAALVQSLWELGTDSPDIGID